MAASYSGRGLALEVDEGWFLRADCDLTEPFPLQFLLLFFQKIHQIQLALQGYQVS